MNDRAVHIQVLDANRHTVLTASLTSDGDVLVGRDPASAEIALPDGSVSRRHCLIRIDGPRVQVRDAGSTNGTRLGRRPVTGDWQDWETGEALQVGRYTLFRLETAPETPVVPEPVPVADAGDQPSVSVGFPALYFGARRVEVADLAATGHALVETDILSIGGGAASFALTDLLRVRGLAPARIRVLTPDPHPLTRLEGWCKAIGLTGAARLRSASAHRLDNPWGVPGYGLSEIRRLTGRMQVGAAARTAGRLLVGSSLADPVGPRLDVLFAGLMAEMERIGWADLCLSGHALGLRQTSDGRFAVAYRTPAEEAEGAARNRFVIARHVHLATGGGSPQVSPMLETFRRRNRVTPRVAAAFEPHDALHKRLETQGGSVAVLGEGHVATLVLARLLQIRQQQRNMTILAIGLPTVLQDDEWPQGAISGAAARDYAAASAAGRAARAGHYGAPSQPDRRAVLASLEEGGREGWFRRVTGTATSLAIQGEGFALEIQPVGDHPAPRQVTADLVIDCRSAPRDALGQPFLRDLIDTYSLARNPEEAPGSGLAMDRHWSLAGLSHGPGLAFASGLPVAGGHFGPVDGFAGCLVAAQAIAARLERPLGLKPFRGLRSLRAWMRWMRGVTP